MKNLLMIAVAFITINVSAQDKKMEVAKERTEMRQDLNPEETAKLQSKKMTLQLDLTDQQQVEVEKLLFNEAKVRMAKKEEFKANREKLQGEKLSIEERLKMTNERLDHQIEMKKKMKAILNAEQYAKFEKSQGKRQGKQRQNLREKKRKD